MKKTRLLVTLCGCAATLSIAAPANAAMVLMLDDSVNPAVTVLDGGAGDINATAGVITYSGDLGAFIVNVSTGVSKPTITGPQILDLNSINITGGAGNLQIKLTDTDYTGSPSALTGSFGGTTIGSVDFDFLYDNANAQFGGTSFFDPAATATNPFSGTGTGSVSLSAPYSLTIIADISHSGDGSTSFDAEIQAIPVPAAVWLFGTGLLGLVGVARRRT
jgi:hypothetical protein